MGSEEGEREFFFFPERDGEEEEVRERGFFCREEGEEDEDVSTVSVRNEKTRRNVVVEGEEMQKRKKSRLSLFPLSRKLEPNPREI